MTLSMHEWANACIIRVKLRIIVLLNYRGEKVSESDNTQYLHLASGWLSPSVNGRNTCQIRILAPPMHIKKIS